MQRDHYVIYTKGQIGRLWLPNRLVRSATWDPQILNRRAMTDDVLAVYQRLAAGGVGLIITGGLTVYRESLPNQSELEGGALCYHDLSVKGIEQLAAAVHAQENGCQIVAQLEVGYLNAGPSDYPSPYPKEPLRALSVDEIHRIVAAFIDAADNLQAAGYDGIQLHAAHGGLLSEFLSPHTNRRQDTYGGSVENRVRIIREIVSGVRAKIGDFPVLIKINATDYLPGGITADNFPALIAEVARAGVDAIEVSGGMWDCLVRSEADLGFRPVPSPEAHTRINAPRKQSYFLPFVAKLRLAVPVILVGGNRDIERLEEIVQQGQADFIAMCRPLIREPDLPNRWREGRGSRLAECVSCNSCLYDMYVHPGRPGLGVVRCVCSSDKQLHYQAQKWLSDWVCENVLAVDIDSG